MTDTKLHSSGVNKDSGPNAKANGKKDNQSSQ